MVLIKKYNFDVLIVKNINNTLSIRIVLFIKEFEVDLNQKLIMNNNNLRPNVNRSVELISDLQIFFYNFSKVNFFLDFVKIYFRHI